MPRSRIALETGTHSPGEPIVERYGVIVAHSCNVRLIGEVFEKVGCGGVNFMQKMVKLYSFDTFKY